MNNSGAYQILIYVSKNTQIKVGKLGSFLFKKGYYVYTGSALKNLNQRIKRYANLNQGKGDFKIRWHIDYLISSPYAKIVDIRKYHSSIKIECKLNQKTHSNPNSSIPIKKFGSSDCNICPAHLIYIKHNEIFYTMN